MSRSDGSVTIRWNLSRHPKVVKMARKLKSDPLRVVGGLAMVWSIFDQNDNDGSGMRSGVLRGYVVESVDAQIGWPGFGAAMVAVGWLVEVSRGEDAAIRIPNPEAHFTTAAKRRSIDMARKRTERDDEIDGADDEAEALVAGVDGENRAPVVGAVGDPVTIPLAHGDVAIYDGQTGRAIDVPAHPDHPLTIDLVKRLRAVGMIRAHAGDTRLSEVLYAGASVDEVAQTAVEMALAALAKTGTTRGWPAIPIERFAAGASPAQMRLANSLVETIKRAMPNVGYLAATVTGRMRDRAAQGAAPATLFRPGVSRADAVIDRMASEREAMIERYSASGAGRKTIGKSGGES